MAAISNSVSLIIGVVVLGFITQEAGATTSIQKPSKRMLQGSTQGKKCMVLKWEGVCDPVDDCKAKIEVKLSKGSTEGSPTEVPLFHPYTYGSTNNSQAVCFHDSSETDSCCNDIISGLLSGHQISFADNEKVNFSISVCHRDNNFTSNCTHVSSSFLLPWKDACLNKPCGVKGTCNNYMTADFYNCTCDTDWISTNCTIPKDFDRFAGKCLKESAATETLENKTIEDCVSKCRELKSDKCKSLEFTGKITSAASKGKCTLKAKNNETSTLVECASDYFQLRSKVVVPENQGNSITALFVSCYIVLAFISRYYLME